MMTKTHDVCPALPYGDRSPSAVSTSDNSEMRHHVLVLTTVLLLAGCAVEPAATPPTPSAPGSSSASPTPAATSSATASASATPVIASATATPGAPANPILPNRAIAEVRVDHLNVREAGNPTALVLGQLGVGARVFVIGEPQVVDALYWYRIAVVSGEYSGANECAWYSLCINAIGHVGSPIDGDPWLIEAEVFCPSSPVAAEHLAGLPHLEQLHCYAGRDVVVTGMLDSPCCGWFGPIQFDPAWLARPDGRAYFAIAGDAPRLWFRMDPATGLEIPARGDVVRATGHFDDVSSSSCRASPDPNTGAEGFDYAQLRRLPGAVATAENGVKAHLYAGLPSDRDGLRRR